MAQRIKRLPAMQETRVQSLGWEDALEKEMATHSSILAGRIPWTEEPSGVCKESDRTERLHFHFLLSDYQVFQAVNAGNSSSSPRVLCTSHRSIKHTSKPPEWNEAWGLTVSCSGD